MPRPDAARDHGADAEHGREVEGVRADDDADREVVLVLKERNDRRRDLGCVGGEGGEQPEERFRQAEAQPNAVEAARERRRRDKHHAIERRRGDGGAGVIGSRRPDFPAHPGER